MTSFEIRSKFLGFFEKRNHAIIPSASLITSDEKGVTNPTLFNTAGMQPLIPYLLGKAHPLGKRLANVQKCLRTVDIDDVGDKTHATFFEMLGNWSLGDYFKEDAIKWSYAFLTSKEEGLGLDPNRLYITVFEGDSNAPKDIEAFLIWKKYIPENHIYFMNAKSNWWEAGDYGPCGPDSEMYYDTTEHGLGDLDKNSFIIADEKREVVEIWNDVFMQYDKKDGKIIGKLIKPSIDTGAGLERLAMIMQNADNIYDTDLLKPIINKIKEFSQKWDLKSARIVADHIRAAVFLIADGVMPSNTDRGYVLRKLLRRAIRHSDILKISEDGNGRLDWIAKTVIDNYKNVYDDVYEKRVQIVSEILREETQFKKTLIQGLKEFEKGVDAFTLFSSYGFPLELTIELAKEKGIEIDINNFNERFKEHQELSRTGAEQKFKGGLANANDEMIIKYHTATHLLNAALRKVLGNHVFQKGSNITAERLRFDFSHLEKLSDEEKKRVEDTVNEIIKKDLSVIHEEMPLEKAKQNGAIGVFDEKYGDIVSVYTIGSQDNYFSKELCGGPHVSHTGILGHFKITKEEAVAQGIRRIKAVLN
jgi:alanyl-tRNA synthetase